MRCLSRYRPLTAGRRVPRLELLEPRQLLSGATLPAGITAVRLEPTAGMGQELVISFDQSYVDATNNASPFSFPTIVNEIDGNADFQLDGPAGTVFGFNNPPAIEGSLIR